MKKSSKTMTALALSLLVFPGSGHLVLGRPLRGVLWGLVFGGTLLAVLAMFAVNFGKMADGMMSPTGDVPMDIPQMMTMAGLGLGSFVVWGLCGLDAFWLARSLPPAPQEEGVGVSPTPPQAPAPPPPPEF